MPTTPSATPIAAFSMGDCRGFGALLDNRAAQEMVLGLRWDIKDDNGGGDDSCSASSARRRTAAAFIANRLHTL